jgi:cysteine-rich repeat protein
LLLRCAVFSIAIVCALCSACVADSEVNSGIRSDGYGPACVVGSVCSNGVNCLFGYCPIIDAGAASNDGGSGDDSGPGFPGVCGDGQRNSGENCDDGNQVDDDACRNDCRAAACGDGVVRSDLGPRNSDYEVCDDGNDSDHDACTNSCVVANCGDGILRSDLAEGDLAYEACDDGNELSTDGCVEGCRVAACGDGFIRVGLEACDPGIGALQGLCDERCALVGNTLIGDGASQENPSSSCALIRTLHGVTDDGLYWLDIDGSAETAATRVFCDMTTQGGGWTKAVALRRGDALWDAWITRSGDSAAGVLYALPFRDFSLDGVGEDLEFFFSIDGEARPIVYRGLRYEAWDPVLGNGVFDDRFELRQFEDADFTPCSANLAHSNAAWNWAAADGSNGCAGYSSAGFIVHGGGGGQHDHAAQLYGMNGLSGYTAFQTIEVFLR